MIDVVLIFLKNRVSIKMTKETGNVFHTFNAKFSYTFARQKFARL